MKARNFVLLRGRKNTQCTKKITCLKMDKIFSAITCILEASKNIPAQCKHKAKRHVLFNIIQNH